MAGEADSGSWSRGFALGKLWGMDFGGGLRGDAELGRAAEYFGDPFGTGMREWLAERIDPRKEEELRQ